MYFQVTAREAWGEQETKLSVYIGLLETSKRDYRLRQGGKNEISTYGKSRFNQKEKKGEKWGKGKPNSATVVSKEKQL